jgi:multiple sugar transport system substrate-binding protein
MDALKFSICKDAQDAREPYDTVLAPFNRAQARPVQLQDIPWNNYKPEITAMALHGQGVDVSQVGAPLVNDLAAMNSLRLFSPKEIDSFGGASAFVPVAWNTLNAAGNHYAVPWIVDPRAVLFWRDIFEEAGVDETTAFTSFENMEQAFDRLQQKGFQSPWAVGTANKLNTFQIACTWIWGLGGEIGQENQILFDQSEALEALIRYFNLYRFMPQAGQNPEATEVGKWFQERKVAVILSGASAAALHEVSPEIKVNLGVALAPGPIYVGGSSLVLWQNSPQPEKAVELIRHLTTHETQLDFAIRAGLFPARLSVLNEGYFKEDPYLSVFAKSVLEGRTYVNMRLSGLIEDMLSNAIGRVWSQIIADPRTEVRPILLRELEPIARRVRLWLE